MMGDYESIRAWRELWVLRDPAWKPKNPNGSFAFAGDRLKDSQAP